MKRDNAAVAANDKKKNGKPQKTKKSVNALVLASGLAATPSFPSFFNTISIHLRPRCKNDGPIKPRALSPQRRAQSMCMLPVDGGAAAIQALAEKNGVATGATNKRAPTRGSGLLSGGGTGGSGHSGASAIGNGSGNAVGNGPSGSGLMAGMLMSGMNKVAPEDGGTVRRSIGDVVGSANVSDADSVGIAPVAAEAEAGPADMGRSTNHIGATGEKDESSTIEGRNTTNTAKEDIKPPNTESSTPQHPTIPPPRTDSQSALHPIDPPSPPSLTAPTLTTLSTQPTTPSPDTSSEDLDFDAEFGITPLPPPILKPQPQTTTSTTLPRLPQTPRFPTAVVPTATNPTPHDPLKPRRVQSAPSIALSSAGLLIDDLQDEDDEWVVPSVKAKAARRREREVGKRSGGGEGEEEDDVENWDEDFDVGGGEEEEGGDAGRSSVAGSGSGRLCVPEVVRSLQGHIRGDIEAVKKFALHIEGKKRSIILKHPSTLPRPKKPQT
ncbi:hypothetical protein HDV00_012348 [Rhizophlyctis rosea]|nr:hypothetical protein HDV00_012348 [Rhizophlyctis rosea]